MNPILEMEAKEILKNPSTIREHLLCEYIEELIEECNCDVKDAEERAEISDKECEDISESVSELKDERDRLEDRLDEANEDIEKLNKALDLEKGG